MRKLITVLFAAMMVSALAACGQKATTAKEQEEPESIKVQSLNANKEEIEVEIPYDPQRLAVLDMAVLDIIDNLGMGDRVVGAAGTSLEYLSEYMDNENITNLGTIKEADLEAVMKCEPDVIFIGGAFSCFLRCTQ